MSADHISPPNPDTRSPELPQIQLQCGNSIADTDRPTAARNPLRQFSLRGRADELEAAAANTKPLLGNFVMQGQATMIYAEPNTGKTLLTLKLCLDAVEEQVIAPSQLFYVNADDDSAGLAAKLRLLQDVGAHMLVPGFEDLKAGHLVGHFQQAAANGSARGTCVIIDTLKKFADLMDKKQSSAFAQVCREYVMAGGTIVALGHTAKNPNADGTPRYQGTTDILEDFDAVYVAQPLTSSSYPTQRVVKLTRKKCRASSPDTVAYAYDVTAGLSYEGKLASLRSIDPDELGDFAPEEEVSDPAVMSAIVEMIKAGSLVGKMALAKAAAKECGASHRAVIDVLERYTGTTRNQHLWDYVKGPRGVRTYRLIDQSEGNN